MVLDCLQLLNNLLRDNASNQLMFREMGFLAELPGLLAAEVAQHAQRAAHAAQHQHPSHAGAAAAVLGGGLLEQQALPPQTSANIAAALDTLLLLTSPPAGAGRPDGASRLNQTVLANQGALPSLAKLCLDGGGLPSPQVRARAARCLAVCAAPGGLGAAAEQVAALQARAQGPRGPVVPLSDAAARAAVQATDPAEFDALSALLEALCARDPASQAALAAAVLGGGGQGEGGSVGLLDALQQQQQQHSGGGDSDLLSANAAGVLSALVAGNAQVKQQLLTHRLPAVSGGVMAVAVTRLVSTVSALAGGAPAQHGMQTLATRLLQLLLLWIADCPPAAAALLADGRAIAPAVRLVQAGPAGGQGLARGLSALLLGTCAATAPAEAPGRHALLHNVIRRDIGLADFFAAMDDLVQPFAQRAQREGAGAAAGGSAAAVTFPPGAMRWVADAEPRVRQRVTQLLTEAAMGSGAQAPGPAPPAATPAGGVAGSAAATPFYQPATLQHQAAAAEQKGQRPLQPAAPAEGLQRWRSPAEQDQLQHAQQLIQTLER